MRWDSLLWQAEKRKEKAAAAEANAGSLTLYVSGVPKEVSFTAVQNLFSKAGEVRRVKLYKDAQGEPKGDGLVTFATEAGLRAAMERDDWALFGEPLHTEAAKFEAKAAGVPREDWERVVVLTSMFSVEEVSFALVAQPVARPRPAHGPPTARPLPSCTHRLACRPASPADLPPSMAQIGSASDVRAFLSHLEESTWVECLRFGPLERVQCFAADSQQALSVRFVTAAAAAECVRLMNGRWYDGRQMGASLFDGNRKRAPDAEIDEERRARLLPPPEPEPEPEPDPDPPPPPPPAAPTEPPPQPRSSRWGSTPASAPDPCASQPADSSQPAPPSADAAEAEPSSELRLPRGCFVKLHGLKSAAERNGQARRHR